MRERRSLEEWLDGLTVQETQWANEYLARKRLMPLLALDGPKLKMAVQARVRREARRDIELYERLKGAIRQKRHRMGTGKYRHAFDLPKEEFTTLQAMATKAKTNRTEVIRRLLLQANPQQSPGKSLSKRRLRDLTLKGRDMEKLAETAMRIADLYAQDLALARAIMTTREIKWDNPKESELVLGRFYYDVLKVQLKKTFSEERTKLRKQLHNIDRRIPRQEQAKRTAKKDKHQNRTESDSEVR